jgi:iron(II)-dependent oxidoreductase
MSKEEEKQNPPFLISDEPLREEEASDGSASFRFNIYADTIAELIANKNNKTPLTIGIYGSWGTGKTTLMRMVENRIKALSEIKGEFRICKTVWFQPWKHTGEDAILAALIEEIFHTMENDGFLNNLNANLEGAAKRLDKNKLLSSISKAITAGSFDVTTFFKDLPHKKKLGFYSAFGPLFTDLIWTYIMGSTKEDSSKPDDKRGALVIFIDDLDRCPKPKILQVLETVKLFINQPGCIFVIGAANEIIEEALQEQGYKDKKASLFMQKMVQATFKLPQKSVTDIQGYLDKLTKRLTLDQNLLQKHSEMIARSLDFNPRGIKLFLNDLSILQNLLLRLNLTPEKEPLENALLCWNILEISYRDFVDYAKENSVLVKDVKGCIKELLDENKDNKTFWNNWQITDEMLSKLDERLHRFIKDKKFVELIQKLSDEEDVIKAIIELTEAVGQPEDFEVSKKSEKNYHPDTMVIIPGGPFLYGDKEEREIKRKYKIDAYPVTNERFNRFISANGYGNDQFWSLEGWKWKEKNKITLPKFWNDPKWNEPDCPVVGVSWYEADAFAKWEGKRLPTELEWERAARGTEGLEYSWGNEFDKEKCNSYESGIKKTTPVTRYPNGISPGGCYDMAGNVWEWTADWYDKNENVKTLRGGSWFVNSDYARCAYRNYNTPVGRYNNFGFRCAQ